MKIAITLRKRNNLSLKEYDKLNSTDIDALNRKKIISTHETIGEALNALATLAIGDEENYTIGTPRYISALGIYSIQRVNRIDINQGWTSRNLTITDTEEEYTNDADFIYQKQSVDELTREVLEMQCTFKHYWDWLIRQKDEFSLREFYERFIGLVQGIESAVEENDSKFNHDNRVQNSKK